MKNIKILLGLLFISSYFYAQPPIGNPPANNPAAQANAAWYRGGNNFAGTIPPGANIFGTEWPSPIYVETNNIMRAMFTQGNTFGPGNDGLRFLGGTCNNYLDMWAATGPSCETTIKFHVNGRVEGANSQLRVVGNLDGLNLNASAGRIFFSRGGGFNEVGRFGLNNFLRVGNNIFPGGPDAARRLEVVDKGFPQFRLTNDVGQFTDFETNNFANLRVNPAGGNVGISLLAGIDPTHTIDVNGNARIRNVIPTATPNSLLVGFNITGSNDIEVQHLGFTGNSNQVLLGNGTWGPAPNSLTANNGVFINSFNQAQLGVPCTVGGFPNIGGIVATQFTEDRVVANRDNNFWIASLDAETGGIGFGGQPVLPFCNTGNTVEISANSKNTQYGSTSASGLRFTKLIAASTPIANGVNGVDNTRVLSVDGDGDVVLVDAGGGITANNGTSIDPLNPANVQLGQLFTGIPAFGGIGQLIQHTEVPLRNNNLHFTGLGNPGNNLVSVGQPNTLFPSVKLYVHNDTEPMANGGFTDGTTIPYNNRMSGVAGYIDNANSDRAAGVYGRATKTQFGLPGSGVLGEAAQNTFNHGVHGRAIAVGNGTINWENTGGYFEASSATLTNYGIYAVATGATGTSYAGYFDGDVQFNGNVLGSQFGWASDQQFKTNVNTVSNAQNIINQLQPKEFYFDTTSFQQMHFSGNKQYGFVAQEVEFILPELVTNQIFPAQYDSSGNQTSAAVNYKALNYNAFIAILMKGMQEQQTTIDSLVDAVETLTTCVNNANLCNTESRTTNNEIGEGKVIELENLNAIILQQNLPNPFAEKTSINYVIPTDVKEAQLLFYDMNGRIIKQVDITERGEGKLTVYGENLQNGIYTYSLIADGKLIATHKMVKQ